MVRRAAALLALCLAAAAPASAESARVEQMLQTVGAEAFAGAPTYLSYVDFDALYAASGFAGGAWRSLPAAEREAQEKLLWDALLRIHTDLPFLSYLRSAEDRWPGWLGFDYGDLDWSVSLGEPPRGLIYLGLDALPAAAVEAALTARGLTRREADGTVYFARGQEGGIDPKSREPGYPFWGELGSAERLALLPHALLGSRFTEVTAAAATGPRLAEDPAVAAAFAAATADAGVTLFQATLLREDFSPWYIKALLPAGTSIEQAQAELEAQAPGPLPAFELVLFGDRQGAAGPEAVLALVYASRAEAEQAAATLPGRLAAFRPQKSDRPLLEILASTATTGVVEHGGRFVALLVLRPDPASEARPAPWAYRTLLRSVWSRDAAWLTWK